MSQTAALHSSLEQTHDRLDVQLRQVSKVFNGEYAVESIDLDIRKGEFFSILGPSGCGKTTTLRLIAGFEDPSSGNLMIQGQAMNRVPAYRRPVNTVFQSYALFNHMTVWDNVAFGLRIKGQTRSEIRERVGEALQLVKMDSFARRYPRNLSGGQQQRVALARALVNRPAVVLLDEPLGALDLKLRKEMQVELSNLHQQLGVTFVMVTHDQEEALCLSDRIAVMHNGHIEQIGTPSEIYDYPKTPFVADFIGDTNLMSGEVAHTDAAMLKVKTQTGLDVMVKLLGQGITLGTTESVVVSVRPEKIQLSLDPPAHQMDNCFEGQLKHVMYLGTHMHCLVQLASGDHITVLQPNKVGALLETHRSVYAYWDAADCRALSSSA
ncbi:MAG: ABC transporter ATP-binding protein [Thainema sp.]